MITTSAPVVNRKNSKIHVFAACLVLVGAATVLLAQEAGISAGGKWMEFDSQNEMTLVKSSRFELDADNSLPGSDSNPKILLFCTGGELKLADFRPNAAIAPPNRPGFGAAPDAGNRPRGQFPQQSRLELGERPLPLHGQRNHARDARGKDLQS